MTDAHALPPGSAAPLSVAVCGARGRMGREVAAALQADPRVVFAGGLDGRAETGVVGAPGDAPPAAVVIDVSAPGATRALLEHAAAEGGPALVIGTTGLSADDEAALTRAAARVAVLRSGNFSLGVNLLLGLVERAARALPAAGWDVEVSEAHHRRKLDAPSGTALMLGAAAARGRGVAPEAAADRARDGITGPRREGAIGFSVTRGGGIVGEHAVLFAAEDELVTLAHSARDRGLFARGAVAAAVWLAGRPAGLYDMQDVLGLGTGEP